MGSEKLPVAKDVWISIKGNGPGDGENDIELITKGKLIAYEDKYIVEYDESQMTGMLGTKTSMSIFPDSITVVREGSTTSNFIFISGQKQDSLYSTEKGDMRLSIFTHRVYIDFDETGGEVDIEYQIDFMHDVGRNYLHLFVKEAKY